MIDLTHLSKALGSLTVALAQPPKNDLERDGVIQRFEYCLELCWRVGQKVLKDIGLDSASPKAVFRDLGRQGFITNAQAWIDFVECRNRASHLYHEEVAAEVFSHVASFLTEAKSLLGAFETHVSKTQPK